MGYLKVPNAVFNFAVPLVKERMPPSHKSFTSGSYVVTQSASCFASKMFYGFLVKRT